jgi:nucleoside-diphosphate-sugar epimerase
LERFAGLTGAGARRLRVSNDRIVVVGAGGWLGLATLELLHRLLGPIFSERVVAFGSSARRLELRCGLQVPQAALGELRGLAPRPSLVVHLAFLTQEKAKVMPAAAYLAANRAISADVLGALDPIGARGVFVASSGAVYRVADPATAESLRLYGGLKLEDEANFTDWAAHGARRCVIARVFNLAGPYVNKQSSYALACFIADALAGRAIQVAAPRPVYRSYVAISELMSVVFAALTDGGAGPIRFDTADARDYEMAQIARAVLAALGLGLGVRRAPLSQTEPDRYVGDGALYGDLRHRYEVDPVTFADQILETAEYMSQTLYSAGLA